MRLTEEQLAMRRQGIGSSDIAAILGVSPYAGASATAVLMDKRGLVHLAREEETTAMRLGHMLEEVAATMYAEDQGVELERCSTVQSAIYPWMMATLDRRVVVRPGAADVLVECKAVGSWMLYDRETGTRRWDKDDPAGIPYDVRVQCTWQMIVSGVRMAHVAAILGGTDFCIYPIPYDEVLGVMLIETGERWWRRYVVEGNDPEPDGSDAGRAYLKAKYPASMAPTMLEATDEQNLDAVAWLELQAREKDAGIRREALSQHFIAAIGEASGIRGDGWTATYKSSAKGTRTFRLTRKGVTVKGGGDE